MSHFSSSDRYMETWRQARVDFCKRVSASGKTELLEVLDRCVDGQFMKLQTVSKALRPGTCYSANNAADLLRDVAQELDGFHNARSVRFVTSVFGQPGPRPFHEKEFLGLWCVIMEFSSRVSPGSMIEANLGCFADGMELEIGSDCRSLEGLRILDAHAFQLATEWLEISRSEDLKCPLGGRAVQLDIQKERGQQRRVA